MRKRNFVIRTIHNGEVKVFHKIFVPSNKWMKYDGRLDGLRVAFGLYWGGDAWRDDFISLCGEEDRDIPGLVDGYYPWTWWYVKEEKCS